MNVFTDNLKEGMVLGEDVYDDVGELILAKGSELTLPMIDRLERLMIFSVNIQTSLDQLNKDDERVQGKYVNAVDRFKSIYQTLSLGGKVLYDEMNDIADPLVEEVMHNPSLTRQLWQIKACDLYTFDHSVMVSIVSAMLAKWAKFDLAEIKDAAIAGLLHDVGKVNIPDEILNKPDKLTKQEFDVMKTHPKLGYILLKQSHTLPQKILFAVRDHHERVDGSGYPNGLTGLQTDSLTKIVCIADIFSAMTTKRVYKSALNPFEVAKELIESGYKILDPTLTHVFVNGMTNYYVGCVVKLSNGQIGSVVLVNKHQPHRPMVKIDDAFMDLSKMSDLNITEIVDENPLT